MYRQFLVWTAAAFVAAGSISSAMAQQAASPAPAQQAAPPDSGSITFSPPAFSPWEAKTGFVLLQRSGLPGRELARGLGESATLNTNQFQFDYELGPDLTIVRHGETADIEFRWFQVHDWISHTPTIHDGTGVGLPFRYLIGVMAPTADGVDLSARYLSQLSNFELNLKRPLTERISVFGGFRFVELNESLVYSATTGTGAVPPLAVRSFNDLYGFQLGSDITAWDQGGPFRLVATGKAGIFGNSARNRADGNNDPDFVDSASTTHAAFLGEIGLNGTYQITPRLVARLGYQVMWIDGVALASEQQSRLDPAHDPLDFGSPSVATGGTAFYHGVVAGIDFRF